MVQRLSVYHTRPGLQAGPGRGVTLRRERRRPPQSDTLFSPDLFPGRSPSRSARGPGETVPKRGMVGRRNGGEGRGVGLRAEPRGWGFLCFLTCVAISSWESVGLVRGLGIAGSSSILIWLGAYSAPIIPFELVARCWHPLFPSLYRLFP